MLRSGKTVEDVSIVCTDMRIEIPVVVECANVELEAMMKCSKVLVFVA